MEKLLNQLLDVAKKDRQYFKQLKHTAVILQQYELASQLKNLEEDLFPETEEVKAKKKIASDLVGICGMCGLQITESSASLIFDIVVRYQKNGDQFSLHDAAEITVENRNLNFDLVKQNPK